MPIKRYIVWCAASHGHDVMESPEGNLVKYSDYQDLQSENAQLKSRLQQSREFIQS